MYIYISIYIYINYIHIYELTLQMCFNGAFRARASTRRISYRHFRPVPAEWRPVIRPSHYVEYFPNAPNGGFLIWWYAQMDGIMDNPMKMDDLVVPLF